ncbi:probable pectate lyase 4 [Momordica charantia]|uniref:Pectate lyase n=1 Tax=Momordica charantia TaxID=3673 RepID=A0A6J1CQQ2_MOMCH|nr:probable pectate lyase 4 [Momordica charantia]
MGNAHGHRKHCNHGVITSPPTNAHSPFHKYPQSARDSQTSSSTPNMESLPYAHVEKSLYIVRNTSIGSAFQFIGESLNLYFVFIVDDGPGSLRFGCRKKEPLWIIFEVSGTIHLSTYLSVSSYKTIDGRGQRIKLTGKGLRLKECEHVIVCNLEFEGGRGHDVDGIQIKPNSKHIWIDRCSLRDYDDGLIDITRGSTDITISRCYFAQHDKTMLIGADPSHVGDRCIRVTIHHCFFDGTRQRHPRVRFAQVHLYNNYTRNWGIYAVCASVESQIFSQFNIYEAGQKKLAFKYLTEKAADKEEPSSGCIWSDGDLFVSGTQSGLLAATAAHSLFHPSQHYTAWTVEPPSDSLKQILQHCTGCQNIPRPADQPLVP